MKVFILIVSLLLLGTAAAAQSTDFHRVELTPKGRMAYDRLSSSCVFRIGGVGYSGETSGEELALYDLLEEKSAIEALKSLVTAGSYEGGLYGLLGLSLKNNGEFNRAVDIYKARKEVRPAQAKPFECNLSDTEEYVVTQSGCLLSTERRTEVVTKIQSGHYDSWLQPKYRPRVQSDGKPKTTR